MKFFGIFFTAFWLSIFLADGALIGFFVFRNYWFLVPFAACAAGIWLSYRGIIKTKPKKS